MAFFEACETGKGWDGCAPYCTEQATFTAQADALNGIDTIRDYANWMRDGFKRVSDGAYQPKGFAPDHDRSLVLAYAVFTGTTVSDSKPPTPFVTNYVYSIEFEGEKVAHVTKIWNDLTG